MGFKWKDAVLRGGAMGWSQDLSKKFTGDKQTFNNIFDQTAGKMSGLPVDKATSAVEGDGEKTNFGDLLNMFKGKKPEEIPTGEVGSVAGGNLYHKGGGMFDLKNIDINSLTKLMGSSGGGASDTPSGAGISFA